MDDPLGSKWLSSIPRRRFSVGDLMVVVALTSLALSAVAVVELNRDRWLMATFTCAYLLLLVGQRAIAGISFRRFPPAIDAFIGVLSYVIACLMFVSFVILGLIIPQGAALLSVAMLLLVVYMTTWD